MCVWEGVGTEIHPVLLEIIEPKTYYFQVFASNCAISLSLKFDHSSEKMTVSFLYPTQ